MEISIVKASINEYEEIIDFANNAFAFESEESKFQNLLPKLYQNNPDCAENHFLLRRNGKLEGLLLCEPDTLKAGNSEIPFYKIGMVAVSSAARGLGHMESLMRYTNDFMKEQKAVFGVLGGLRHRYERFGFHPASCYSKAIFMAKTLAKKEHQLTNTITVTNLEEREEWVNKAFAMHKEQMIHCVRKREDFLQILKSWSSTSFAILDKEEFLGYCCIRQNEGSITIEELLLKKHENALDVVKAIYAKYPKSEIVVELPMSDLLVRIFLLSCDEYVMMPKSSYHVLDFAKLLEPLLKVAVMERNISDSKMAFIIGKTPLYVEICNKNVMVSREIPSSMKPMVLSEALATQMFFGPLGLVPMEMASMAEVFPLPLFIPNQDCC